MAIKIMIPTPLRQYTEDKKTVESDGNTVGAVLQSITEKYPELKKHLFNEKNELRNFVNVYVNDEDMRHLQGEKTEVKDEDELMIVPAIAGGSRWS